MPIPLKPGPELREALWRELHEGEEKLLGRAATRHARASAVAAAAYHMGRRRLAHVQARHAAAGRLPPPWQTMLAMSARNLRRCLAMLGVDLLAMAVSGMRWQDMLAWLSPAGESAGRLALRRVKRPEEARLSQGGLENLRKSYLRLSATRSGTRLVIGLAQFALADLFAQLDGPTRSAARRFALTNLPQTLERAKGLGLTDRQDLLALARIVRRVALKLEARYAYRPSY